MKRFISILLVALSLFTYGILAMGSDDDSSSSSSSSGGNSSGDWNGYGKSHYDYNNDGLIKGDEANDAANDWLKDNW